MAIKQRLNYKNSSGSYDAVYLETDASVVLYSSSTTYSSGSIGYTVRNLDRIPDDSNSSNRYHLGVNNGALYIKAV